MNRLLQGDVGAGKTIVALLAAIVAMENRLQVAFMAPTEILADQHYLTIRRLLDKSRFRVALADRQRDARRSAARFAPSSRAERSTSSSARTRSPSRRVEFHELGLVIIDEQHRFGVIQRATLREKGRHPDVLVMTATPIPRTLALTAYGDLDVVGHPRTCRRGDSRFGRISRAGIAARRRLPSWRGASSRRAGRPTSSIRSSRSRRRSTCARRRRWPITCRPRCSPSIASRCCTAASSPTRRIASWPRSRAATCTCSSSTTVVEVGVDVAERDGHDRRARRAVRAVAASSAARARRPRRASRRPACCCISRR